MEENNDIIIENIIKESKKIKNKEDRDDFLLKHRICPFCLTQTVTKDISTGEVYCTKCGFVFEEIDFYYSHGTTMESGNREEIYIEPTDTKAKSTASSGFYVDKNVSSNKRALYKRLQKEALYASEKYANSYIYKSIAHVVSLMSKNALIKQNKNAIIDTAMQIYKKQIKNKKRKIKPQILISLALKKIGLIVPNERYITDSYQTLYNKRNRTILNYKNSLSRYMSKEINKYSEKEKETIRKYELQEILLSLKIYWNGNAVEKLYLGFKDLVNYNPNLNFKEIIEKLIMWKQLEIRKEKLIEKENWFILKNKPEELNIIKNKIESINKKEEAIKSKVKNIDKTAEKYLNFKV